MTLPEFLGTIEIPSNKKRVVAVLYHNELRGDGRLLSADGIRAALKRARVPGSSRINVFDVLAKCGGLVDSERDENGRRVWRLTKSGRSYIQAILCVTTVSEEVQVSKALASRCSAVKDERVREYIEEALVCLGAGALRAAVVFLWTGAIRELHNVLLEADPSELNRVLTVHDPNSRRVKCVDDFAYVKDSNALLAAQDLGIIDKGQRQALEEGLHLRNRCGHPTQYRPGANKVAAFAEDIASILFLDRDNEQAA